MKGSYLDVELESKLQSLEGGPFDTKTTIETKLRPVDIKAK